MDSIDNPNRIAVNLGCGITVAPNWVNVDNSPNARLSKWPILRFILWKVGVISTAHYKIAWPKSIRHHDLNKQLPFSSDSIDFIYSSHVLEHLVRKSAEGLCREIFRVLKPGGMARIVVPDLMFGVAEYLRKRNEVAAIRRGDHAADEFIEWMQLSNRTHRCPHAWMYDDQSLPELLGRVGFVKVEKCDFKKGRVPDIELLDNRPGESLHVEAEKPL